MSNWQDSDVRAEYANDLRKWAKGNLSMMAATELLIRGFDGSFINPGFPWMQVNEDGTGTPWINFDEITYHIGAKSGGERRFLTIVASLGSSEVDVNLYMALSLDQKHMDLVVCAVAHAGGFGEKYPWPSK